MKICSERMIHISELAHNFQLYCKNILLQEESVNKTILEITKKLNSYYYEEQQCDDKHMYVVGSVGRKTAVKNNSDLDLLFDLPKNVFSKFNAYNSNGQTKLLQEVKEILKTRFPQTDIRGDGQVVVLDFNKYTVELVPAFKQTDNRFKYPDTHNGGSWKYTDPIREQEYSKKMDNNTSGMFFDFCHIIRGWKNKTGFKFKGLLIDSLVYKYFENQCDYYEKDYNNYFDIFKDILSFLSLQDKNQTYWFALGSNQKVYSNGKFIYYAKKALKQLENSNQIQATLNELLGNGFLQNKKEKNVSYLKYDDTEQFIEDMFPVDIKYNLTINGTVSQNGYRSIKILGNFTKNVPILHNCKIEFFIEKTDCPKPDSIYWKVRNVGKVAEERNMIRGQIIEGGTTKKEPASFKGPHYVECYFVKNGICIARSKIMVPIGDY